MARCRRGYFIEGLGAAQFATGGTIDRLRTFAAGASGLSAARTAPVVAIALAATDPANAYGAALPWPTLPGETTHRPGRKAGALVVLVDGALALYVERGGKTVVAFETDASTLAAAAASLAALVTAGRVQKIAVESVNGVFVIGTDFGAALGAAGFTETPKGLRLRA
jgi:ATP-dependent Lhr-like helicase